jgi:hypothetical protein
MPGYILQEESALPIRWLARLGSLPRHPDNLLAARPVEELHLRDHSRVVARRSPAKDVVARGAEAYSSRMRYCLEKLPVKLENCHQRQPMSRSMRCGTLLIARGLDWPHNLTTLGYTTVAARQLWYQPRIIRL